jgi:hypothetical protein
MLSENDPCLDTYSDLGATAENKKRMGALVYAYMHPDEAHGAEEFDITSLSDPDIAFLQTENTTAFDVMRYTEEMGKD